MSSYVVHDLKNLVNLQALVLENAQDRGNDPEFTRDALRTFAKTTDKMNLLIAALAAPPASLELRWARVSPIAIVESALADVRLDRSPGVRLVRRYAPDSATGEVLGDPDLLHKVLGNLLINARQSLPEQGGTITVSVGWETESVRVAVHDTGAGMTDEFLCYEVFRPFHTTKRDGTGLGLFQCRAVVEAHGGRILIDSRRNEGTTVTVVLPVAPTVEAGSVLGGYL
jgi:hypothetical protein